MYDFLDRFINLALPRTRDFQGVPDKSFDGRGNYTIGIKEHTIFPEIDTDKVSKVHGMDITFVTSAETDAEAYALLKHFGMPLWRSYLRLYTSRMLAGNHFFRFDRRMRAGPLP